MPMLSKTEVGLVIAIWGQAWVRGADGMFRALKLGDTLHKGTVVLTEQDAIVQLGREDEDDTPEIVAAAPKKTPQTLDADQAIADINKGKAEAAPAAGLGGGDGGDLQPGLRVERIAEVAPGGALLHSAGNADALTPPELLAGHEAVRRVRAGRGDGDTVVCRQIVVEAQVGRHQQEPILPGQRPAGAPDRGHELHQHRRPPR